MADKKNSRDRLGRWKKGFSGNSKGRPGKYARIDTGDLLRFKGTVIEVPTPEGRVMMMTREAAILHRLYQSAMKGNVHAQIFLARRFDKLIESRESLSLELHRILSELEELGRKPTEHEAYIINAALKALDLERWAEDQGLKWKPKQKRRRRPQRRASKGDAAPND